MESVIGVYILCLVIMIFIDAVIAKKFEKIAFAKGYDESIHSFAMCFWLGVVGYLYVIALPDLTLRHTDSAVTNTQKESQDENNGSFGPHSNLIEKAPMKAPAYVCPKCHKLISYGVPACPYCQQTLSW